MSQTADAVCTNSPTLPHTNEVGLKQDKFKHQKKREEILL